VTLGIIHISSGISKLIGTTFVFIELDLRWMFWYRVLKLATVATLSIFSCSLWWKLLSTNIQRNESIFQEISRYRFQLHFFLTYRLTCYLIMRPSDFARNVAFWLSYPVYSSSDTEKWILCEKSHLCLRIAVSAYLNVGPFGLIRAPVVLTPVPIRERSCLLVEKRQICIYSLEGVAAVCRK